MKTSRWLEYSEIGELLGIPGVLSPNGINYYIIIKRLRLLKTLEKDITKEDYYISCLNYENRFL